MRSWQGTRMIWVGAVCIDQTNLTERNTQVANMSKFYQAGSRVVVYLGRDIAVSLQGRHPRRRRLPELESGIVIPNFPQSTSSLPPHKLRDILQRLYFSRI